MKDYKTYRQEITASLSNTGHYEHFGIHKMTASLYGNEEKDIIKVLLRSFAEIQ